MVAFNLNESVAWSYQGTHHYGKVVKVLQPKEPFSEAECKVLGRTHKLTMFRYNYEIVAGDKMAQNQRDHISYLILEESTNTLYHPLVKELRLIVR